MWAVVTSTPDIWPIAYLTGEGMKHNIYHGRNDQLVKAATAYCYTNLLYLQAYQSSPSHNAPAPIREFENVIFIDTIELQSYQIESPTSTHFKNFVQDLNA
jgi:hypothetical protein